MQLIYFSAVPWASFSQRPHEFVRWAQGRLGARVLWIEPYPVRLPGWQDLSRPAIAAIDADRIPPWLEIVAPRAIPAEPLAAGRAINRSLFWPKVLGRVREFAKADPRTAIVVGKPSDLALQALHELPAVRCLYDAMDDFPAFHEGLARETNARIESEIVTRSAACSTSSTFLAARLRKLGAKVHLVPNGLASDRLPSPKSPGADGSFGYVGTLGPWFDWAWLVELASDWPQRTIEIHGPVYRAPDRSLPANIQLHPALPHDAALAKMATFAAGLIPFQRNELTESVDPVKYYEYRGLGLPVLSTPFGEMRQRGSDPRVLLAERPAQCHDAIARLLDSRDTAESVAAFRQANAWDVRFEPLAAELAA